jgi:ATP-dependent DNA helicase RecG
MTTIDGTGLPEPDPTPSPTEQNLSGTLGQPRLDSALEAAEPPLPLLELERAIGPIRRVVSFAMSAKGSGSVRYLGANLTPHVVRAARLDLPSELRERVLFLQTRLEGFDVDSPPGQQFRLADLFATLSRIDTLAGLPVPDRLRPVPKPQQADEPERPGPSEETEPPQYTPTPHGAESVSGPVSGSLSGLTPAPTPLRPGPSSLREPEEDEEDTDSAGDGGLAEFVGELSQPLVELVPLELAAALAEHGIDTVRDLALLRPRLAETLQPVHGAGRALPLGRVAVGGRIRLGYTVFRGTSRERWSLVVGAGPLPVRWAEPADGETGPELWREVDERVVLVGTFDGNCLFDASVVYTDGREVKLAAWDVPGVPDRVVRSLWEMLADALPLVRDPVSAELLRRLDLPSLGTALTQAHLQLVETGRKRLALDEVLLAQLAGTLPRLAPGRERGIGHPILHNFSGKMGQVHDLVLYDDAQLHLEEIKRDLRRSSPMRRVLTGEVGAGKGSIALIVAAMVADAKAQVLFVGADAIEVENRFLFSEPLLREGGFVSRLLPGAPTRGQLDAIKRGEVHVIFGTFELLEQSIEYRRLGLVIAVEREHFGRASVLHSSLPVPRPDLLVLTSIPVGPRVLLTAYADHHVSVIRDPKRRPARIELCRPDERPRAYEAVREAVAQGAQALVVFPMVDGLDAVDIPGALRLVRALEADVLAGLRVGLLHGALPREERVRIYEDFVHRRLDVLVSTTRVEDGPALPTVAVVVLEQADRFDQWRLHRIIGHASRAELRDPDERTKAILVVGEMAEPDASARIERVLAAPNGFQLTEALVALRGVDGTVAPGHTPLPALRWFDLDTDLPLLLAAREETHRILRADPGLRRGTHGELAAELRMRWDTLFPGSTEQGWTCPIREEPTPEPRRRRRRRRRKK